MENKLKQDEGSFTTYFGWYGYCSEDCFDYDLNLSKEIIHAVYQFNENGSGVQTYLSSAPDFLQSFLKLECGRGYWIVLKKGNSELELKNFKCSYFNAEPIGKIVEEC